MGCKKIMVLIIVIGFVLTVIFEEYATGSRSVFAFKGENNFSDFPFVPVLMYHHFAPGFNKSLVVDPEQFRKQLAYIKLKGYNTISLDDFLLFLQEEKGLPEKPLLITIDDGYASNYQIAYPILKEMGMKAVIFSVVSSFGSVPDNKLHFTWEEAKEMVDSGFIDIQSHTFNAHFKIKTRKGPQPWLVGKKVYGEREESQEQYEERIREDLLKSKMTIEQKIGRKVFALACPYGACNETVKKIASELGYELIFSVKTGVNIPGDSPLAIKRLNVHGRCSGEDIDNAIRRIAIKRQIDIIASEIRNSLAQDQAFQNWLRMNSLD